MNADRIQALLFELVPEFSHWIVVLLAVFLVAFLIFFVVPGLHAGWSIKRARKTLAQMKAHGPVLDLDKLESAAMRTAALRHAWNEYRDTLHGEKKASTQSQMKVMRWRATSLANAFFTDQTLVDARLHTEFFKHLPGILTGLGIIGTFSGMIVGLQAFKVVDDPNVVRDSLTTLVNSVGVAFLISASAISLAMLVTLVEKLCLNALYTGVEKLCGLIDSLFDSGASEDYLQRLVEASETSATQAQHIKDALVADLKQVLTELTQQQIAGITASGHQTAERIAQSLAEGLHEPLTRISKAVENVSGDQGQAVNKLVTDVLSSFAAQMEGLFGKQLASMNDVLRQTAQSIQAASQRFDTLADKVQNASAGAVETMGKRMEEMLQTMQARQSESNTQMAAFVEQLRATVAQSHTDSGTHMKTLLEDLSAGAGRLVQSLNEQALNAQKENASRQAALAHHTGELMGQQREQVHSLCGAVQEAAREMRAAVELMKSTTTNTVDSMKTGAASLHGAAERLTTNLNAMREASDGLGGTAQTLLGSTQTLASATNAASQALAEQRAVRDAVASMVRDLAGVVDNAKREAGMTEKLISGLEVASQRLGEARAEAETYLEGVTAVLGDAHASFAKEIENTLRKGNGEFQKQLAEAVGLLKGAIQEIGDVVDSIPERA